MQGHKLGDVVNRTVLETSVEQKKTWSSVYCLQGEVPWTSIATSWLAPEKATNLHTCSTWVCGTESWFKKMLQRTKHTPLLNALMKGIIRRVLILNVTAWLKGKLFTVSSILMHPKKAKKDYSSKPALTETWQDWDHIVGVCTLTVWDTDKLMPAGTVRVVLNSKNYQKKSQGAHFLLVLSDVLLILQPQIWLLGDLLSYKFCSIPLTRHGALLNNNKIYLHMNWQSAPWLIVLKQRKTRRNNSNSICSFTCVHLSDELSSRFVSKIEST